MVDTQPPDPEEVRRQLIRLVKQKGKRKQDWTRERPTDWRPQAIFDREMEVAFTTPRAWDFIEERLAAGCQFTTTQILLLNRKLVWVHVMLENLDTQRIYIKLEIVNGGREVFGWSFHVSEYATFGS